ncbi:MAG TPA: MBL fold metallo-hydrolase [Thermoplasmata archaeon]|nr:MBL fold metallo-hydrolase [Thermoplasmata archaeon]
MAGLRKGPIHFRVTRVDRGIWAAIAIDGGYALCNAGIVDLGGTTVVFDSMLTPEAGTELRRAARRCTDRDPAVVVNSHWHGDHIRGNAAFAPAVVISTPKTRELIRTAGVLQWKSDRREMPAELARLDSPDSVTPEFERALYRGWFEGTLRVPAPFRPMPPNVTFEKELSLRGTLRELRLVTYGGGHSPSDVFAYLPEEGVVFLGDLVSIGVHPAAGDGVPADWAKILRRIGRLEITAAVPGHGPVGNGRDIRRIESYMGALVREARSARRHGKTGAVLATTKIPEPFRGWKFSNFYPENLLRAYRLLGRSSG